MFTISCLVYTGDAVFDAAQYSFFGNDSVEEVELGGLEDEEDEFPPVGFDDEQNQLERKEVTFFFSVLFI